MSLILRLILLLLICTNAVADDTLHALTYDFTVTGLEGSSVEKKFNAISSLEAYKNNPLYSEQNLNKRIYDDHELLLQMLDAKGLYDAQVNVTQKVHNYHTQITFEVTKGSRYKIKKISILMGNAKADVLEVYPFFFEDLPIQVGKYVSAEKIHETFGIIIDKFSNCGYPYAKIKDHSVELVEGKKRILLSIDVEPGPKMKFGEVVVTNMKDVPESFVKHRVPWQPGEVYDHRKLERYREKLTRTRLFDTVLIETPEEYKDGEHVPLVVKISERKARTISAGLKYSLNEGFGATVGWTHRNLTSNADRVRTTLTYGQVLSKFELDYEVPDFLWPKTTLVPAFAIVKEDTESYTSQSIGSSVVLRNEFEDKSDYFYGVSIDHDRAKQEGEKKTANLFGIPMGFTYDQRDDIIDPLQGYLINASFTPKFGRVGDAYFMTKSIVSGSYYYPVAAKVVMAGWARVGSIAGINFSDVVANQRYYSGGGGSVRGYGYQMLGPLDASGDPTGGKSLLEGGVELRVRVLEDWGGAAFVEGGNVSHSTVPNLKNDTLFGAGVGVRYFTSFGPIRADIAMPFKRRKKANHKYVDMPVQFYISIGQGF